MREASGLSGAFVESHPADAARVLEGLGATDTAGFVAALPPRLAAPILRHLSAPFCARVLELLDDTQLPGLVEAMGPQAAARVVEQLAAARQLRLLGQISVGASIAIRLLIGYPKGTCGACMDPWPLALVPDMPVADAIEETRKFQGDLGDCLFVSNGQRRLLGVVAIGQLVRCGAREPLSAIMVAPAHVISALASARAVAGHPGWDVYHVLPVVERENRLVGALHRHALTAALSGLLAQSQPAVASGLFGQYWQTLAALAEVVIEILPRVPAVADERRKNER